MPNHMIAYIPMLLHAPPKRQWLASNGLATDTQGGFWALPRGLKEARSTKGKGTQRPVHTMSFTALGATSIMTGVTRHKQLKLPSWGREQIHCFGPQCQSAYSRLGCNPRAARSRAATHATVPVSTCCSPRQAARSRAAAHTTVQVSTCYSPRQAARSRAAA